MTYKEKAEAYVREQLPELIDESWKWAKVAGLDKAEEVRSLEIIGHPIQLQHWLMVLGEKNKLSCKGDGTIKVWIDKNAHIVTMYFNLTTGQPATEADYQAFCKIVGIC